TDRTSPLLNPGTARTLPRRRRRRKPASLLAEPWHSGQCAAMASNPGNRPQPPSGGPPDDPAEPDSRRAAALGRAITGLIVIAGYYLMTALRQQGKLEDCLMAGRSNCAPIDTGPAK